MCSANTLAGRDTHTSARTLTHTALHGNAFGPFSCFLRHSILCLVSTRCSGTNRVIHSCPTLSQVYFYTGSFIPGDTCTEGPSWDQAEKESMVERERESMNDMLNGAGTLDCAALTHKTSVSQFSDVSLKALSALIF